MNKEKIYNLLLLFAPILLLYIGWFQYGFIQIDDGGQVLENTKLHTLSLANLKEIFSSATVGMYQPLTSLSFAFIILLFGFKSALAFHIFSFLLHCANTYLVHKLGKELLEKRVHPILLPLLFALHPLAVEAVAWVSATSTLIFTLFFLLASLSYLKYLEKQEKKHYSLSLLYFTLGCFAKVQILPFVGVLFLLEYLKQKPFLTSRFLFKKLPFVVIALIFAYITISFRGDQSGFTQDYNPVYLFPNQLAWYISKLFVPLNLGIVYDWPKTILSPWFYIALIILVGVAVLVYKNRKNRLFIFGIAFYVFNIILHTAPFSTFLGPYADRYAYLSSLGIWIAVISLPDKKKAFAYNIAGFALVVVFFFLAKKQTTYWENTIALWSNNLKHQKSTFSNGMRGALYYQQKKYPQAQADFEKVDKDPDPRFEPEKYSYLYNALGNMTTNTKPRQSAIYFSKGAKRYPNPANINNAGIAYKKIKDYKKAEAYFKKTLEVSKHPKFYSDLVSLYYETQQFDKGEVALTEAIENGFDSLLFYKMRCFFRVELKKYELAANDFEVALKILKDQNKSIVTDGDLLELKGKLKNYLKQ